MSELPACRRPRDWTGWQPVAAQFLRPLLFHVEARDPATFAAAAGVLVAAGLRAVWLPARRAGRLDPAAVLREG